ncbi:uncharacterized protein [Anabrus simplex]|uniref:uncharacterized protein n=1 Tax=Anabrus simplex TaxID=316456 RepID=UPI0035A355B5
MSFESSVVWIRDTLVPRMLEVVPMWKGATVIKCEIAQMAINKDGFASLLFSVDLWLNCDGKRTSDSIIVKIMFFDDKLRAAFQSEKQFANEIHFYSKVLPLFESVAGAQLLFPRYYYSSISSSPEGKCREEDAVIVMEDLRPKGFRLGNRSSLDFDHCVLALKQIGRFHALSYAMKHLDEEAFHRDVVSKILETLNSSEFSSGIGAYNKRVTEALKTLSPENSLAETLQGKVTDPKIFENLITPKEPLAVLCHGDFCRNNMLFNYDEKNKVCDVRLLDLQTIRYASPAIDLSFFLFMNTTAELRKQSWDQLFESYHKEVCGTLAKVLGKPEESLDPCYSLEAFKEDFRQHALYGYIITVTFLPCMLGSDQEREEMTRSWQESFWDVEHMQDLIDRIGGVQATDALVSLVLEMREKSFL